MKAGKQIVSLSLIAFVLHIIWENLQAPLFQGYESFVQHFSACFIGTIGDVIFTLFVCIMIALVKENFNWINTLNKKDLVVLIAVAFFFSIGIEQRALLFGRWDYADTMPIIPYLKVGLTPVLQMILLLPFSIYLTKLATTKVTHQKARSPE